MIESNHPTTKADRKKRSIVHTVAPSSHSAATRDAPSRGDRWNDPCLQKKLLEAVNRIDNGGHSINPLLSELRLTLAPAMVDHFERDENGALQSTVSSDVMRHLPSGMIPQVLQWANESCETGQTKVQRISGPSRVGSCNGTIVTTPVMYRDRAPEALCAFARYGTISDERVVSVLQVGATHFTVADTAKCERRARHQAQDRAAVLELLSATDSCEQCDTAYQTLVDQLQTLTDCRQVAIGLVRHNRSDSRLAAVSGIADFDKQADFASDIESAINESILRDNVLVCRQQDPDRPSALNSIMKSAGATMVIASPLKTNDGECVGGWLFIQDDASANPESIVKFVSANQSIMGSRVAMIRRGQPHRLLRPLAAIIRTAGTKKFVSTLLACSMAVAALTLPMPYRIACDCQLEPVSRRFVAAPYDGTLEESFAKAGQIVSKNTLLARMDPRELRWELSGLVADRASESKKRDAAAAREEFALAQQSELEVERFDQKIQLIQYRLDNLEIKSPIDGIVIAGDLENSEGAPLSIGQAMFEIGPLEEMLVEVAIPEREILYVRPEMDIEVRLNAAQLKTIHGKIKRISPRNEMREKHSVYIAEVELDNRSGQWRPGMKGTAKIVGDDHPLGWNLMHRAWESVAMWMGV